MILTSSSVSMFSVPSGVRKTNWYLRPILAKLRMFFIAIFRLTRKSVTDSIYVIIRMISMKDYNSYLNP